MSTTSGADLELARCDPLDCDSDDRIGVILRAGVILVCTLHQTMHTRDVCHSVVRLYRTCMKCLKMTLPLSSFLVVMLPHS